MKKLLLVEVPDYIMNIKILGFDKHNDDNGFLECKEITLPSEEDIKDNSQGARISWEHGARWAIEQILNQ